MKWWIGLAAALYPRSWREQYGKEFSALLDDVKPRWSVFANVLGGAIRMQTTTGASWLKLVAATATAGAIVAAGASFMVAPQYLSTAVVSVTPQPDPLRPASPQPLQQRAAESVTEMEEEALSRRSLSSIIKQPSLDLYKAERRRMPLEDVVQQMRRNIRIEAHPSTGDGLAPVIFSVSFSYPDQVKAQAAVRELAARFTGASGRKNRFRTDVYRRFWQDMSASDLARPTPPPPPGEVVAVLDPASAPKEPLRPNRIAFLAWGLGAGLLLGLLAALARRRPRLAWRLLGFSTAGCVLAGAASFLIPNRYESTAVMRVTPAVVTEDPLEVTPAATPAAEFLRQMEPPILSFQRLSKMIKDPGIDLYPRERARRPMDEVVRNMLARDLRISVLSPAPGIKGAVSAFSISFSYPDQRKAQRVVQALITALQEQHLLKIRDGASQMSVTRRQILERKAGENLEVLDTPSFPESPESPNRLVIAAVGLGIGLLLGVVTLWFRPRPSPTLQPA